MVKWAIIGSLGLGGLFLTMRGNGMTMGISGARGIRNNNPGNIRMSNSTWRGKIPHNKNTDGEFEQFESAHYGLRALARNLRTYWKNYSLRTVQQWIQRWAPPEGQRPDGSTYEQDTAGYVAFVAERAGLRPTDPIEPNTHLVPIIMAMVQKENGSMPYSYSEIEAAIKASGWDYQSHG